MAQLNPCVGDLSRNALLIKEWATKAHELGAHVVVFPEMVVTGYPVEDLALRASFRKASRDSLSEIVQWAGRAGLGKMVLVVGYLDESEGGPQNALAVIQGGEMRAKYVKVHLPNYGVFDEFRNFVPGGKSLIFRLHGIDIAVAICEDIWQDDGIVAELISRKPGILLVPNGSPFERNKDDVRLALVERRARELGAPVVYVNMTGGQDDLVFDGDSIVVDQLGQTLYRAPRFDDHLALVDLQLRCQSSIPDVILDETPCPAYAPLAPHRETRLDDLAEVWQALVVGLRDYAHKNSFSTAAIALSGGIDSALVATLAVDALGASNVYCYGLPSKYSSTHSLKDAQALADNTGLNFSVISIAPMVESFVDELRLSGIAEENVQARVRGTTMMGISNQFGHLVLATGNKSELAVGYSTLYGDAVGGYAPIKDLYKVDVWALARWRNSIAELSRQISPIPINSIEKEPSAELRPGQKDSDSLPEYSILDEILVRYIEGDEGAASLIASGLDAALVRRVISMVDRAEYKRRQYPPGTKVSRRAFGKDRRLPMTSHWIERI
ncbi:MAG: NAD+ synthase [Actinobacteria bacterium]|nr:NAD+ synthase [Actinomycetota bacterium]